MTPELSKLLPFVLRAKLLVVGRERLRRSRNRLQFIWITTDLSENSYREILRDFAGRPVVQAARSSELEEWFGLHNAKVVGLSKSSLAREVLRLLGPWVVRPPGAEAEEGPSSARGRTAKQRRRDRGSQDESTRPEHSA